MITEAQRRALFALREALHLCDEAEIEVFGAWCNNGTADVGISFGETTRYSDGALKTRDVETILEQYPEPN